MPDLGVIRNSELKLTPPTVVFSTPILGIPPIGGPALRTQGLIRALATSCNLTVHVQVPWVKADVGRVTSELESMGVRKVVFHSTVGENIVHRNFFRLKSKLQRIFGLYTRRIAKELSGLLNEDKASCLWLNFGHVSFPLLKAVRKESFGGYIVCDTDAVWSRFILRGVPYLPLGLKPMAWIRGKMKELEERHFSVYADVITAPSGIDLSYYRKVSIGAARFAITENVLDLKRYQTGVSARQFSEPTVVLTGSFNYRHSAVADSARWLRNEIWPLVLERVPQAQLLLIGPGSLESDLADSSLRIKAMGQVESTLPHLARADVVVVPLRYESGTRFKILEAGILERCVVSTTLGSEGLPVIHGEHVLIADTAWLFAMQVCWALRTRPVHLGQNLFHLVQERYLIRNLEHSVSSILAQA